jgi:hypothetical protein
MMANFGLNGSAIDESEGARPAAVEASEFGSETGSSDGGEQTGELIEIHQSRRRRCL